MLEHSSETASLHNIIVGFLIGTICILTAALFILMGPSLWNFIRRKIPVSQQRVDRRYDTIERWLISKRIRANDACDDTSKTLLRPSCSLSHDEEAPSPDYHVNNTSSKFLHIEACEEVQKDITSTDEGRITVPSSLLKTHSDLTTPSVQTETTEPSHSSHEPVIDDDSCASDPEEGSTLSTTALECSICLEPFLMNDVVSWSTNISCGHVYHHQCIKEWLLRRTGCPFCRLPLLSVDCKNSRKFSDEELTTMVAEWRNRMSTTYYCIKNGLVELDGKLSRKDKDLIAPCVKREELVKMRRTSVSDSKS